MDFLLRDLWLHGQAFDFYRAIHVRKEQILHAHIAS